MKNLFQSPSFYDEANNLVDIGDYEGAIKYIKNKVYSLESIEDIALAYLNCGFLNEKLGHNLSAIEDFSRSISLESNLDYMKEISKDISLSGRSNARYKVEDYLGAIEDKRLARKIRLSEIDKFSKSNNTRLYYKNILLLINKAN